MNKEKNYNIIWILLLGFILRYLVCISVGDTMNLYSDDNNYVYSAIDFIKSGHITYGHKQYLTVFTMPGICLLLSSVFRIFGYSDQGLHIARVIYNIIGTLTIYGVYLCSIRIFNKKTVANIAAFLVAICLPFISLDNLFLTETPSICIFVFLTYYIMKFCQERSNRNFICMIVFYLLMILFKPTYGIYPIAFLPLMLAHKISIKEMIWRGGYVALVLVVFLSPWWIRNYQVLGEFVPLTGNQGDTKLLGSFDGVGVPEGTYEEYVKLADQIAQEKGNSHPYYRMKERGILGEKRIQEWRETNLKGYLYSTLIYKPCKLLQMQYYPRPVFNLGNNILYFIYRTEFGLFLIGLITLIFNKKRDKNAFWAGISVLLGTLMILLLNSFYAAIPRYGVLNNIVIILFTAYTMHLLYEKVIRKTLLKVEQWMKNDHKERRRI